MKILSDDSILRKVPMNVNPKQVLFVDGIRHSAEIIELAYERLENSLTEIALIPPCSKDLPRKSASVFLDAWAIIDAIDRFRMLYQMMPGISFSEPAVKGDTLKASAQPFRDLRNVADHLAERADFIVSKKGSALGVLTWITGYQIEPEQVWHCTLKPGTMHVEPELKNEQLEVAIHWPTDRITLMAGGYEGNISSFLPQITKRVQHFEKQLEEAFLCEELRTSPVASDAFLRVSYARSHFIE